MKIGIQLSSIKAYLQTAQDFDTSVGRLARMGYTEAQLQWHNRDIPIADLAASLQTHGLTSWGVQDFYDTMRNDLDYYKRLALATHGPVLCPSGIPDRLLEHGSITLESVKRCAEELNSMQASLAREGITVTFHPRWKEWVPLENGMLITDQLLLLCDPAITLTGDLYHVAISGLSVPDLVRKYKGRQTMVHYKDCVNLTDRQKELVPAGQGCLPAREILDACRESSVACIFAEQESWSRDAFLCMEESYSFLSSHCE